MAKIRGGDQFLVRLIFAFLFLNVVTAQHSDDVPFFNEYSSFIDQEEQEAFGKNYPVVTVELLPMNQLRATQRRFQIDQPGVSVTEYTFNITLHYRTKGGNNGHLWLNKTEDVFGIPLNSSDDWILFNVGRECRVKYDDVLWSRITKQLKDNHTELPESGRSRLFMDARNLAKVGLLGYDKVLDLIRYASKDRGFMLWYHIYDFANYFKRMIYDSTSFSQFQSFMLNVTSSVRDEMTFKISSDWSFFELVMHPYIWSMSCNFGHKDCIEKTTRVFRAQMESNTSIYDWPPDGYRHVACIGMANSLLESDWNAILDSYLLPENWIFDGRRMKALYALSCSRNFTLLERLLDVACENSAKDRFHFPRAMDYIDSHPLSNYTVWKWLRLNRAKVEERAGPGGSLAPPTGYLVGLAYNLKTREHRQEVLDFFDNYPKADQGYKSMILDTIDRNIRWRDRNLASIHQWFKQNAHY